jgi:hypothetical protein
MAVVVVKARMRAAVARNQFHRRRRELTHNSELFLHLLIVRYLLDIEGNKPIEQIIVISINKCSELNTAKEHHYVF